jgi:hypothetical protein
MRFRWILCYNGKKETYAITTWFNVL